ncbi:hypothetical protein C0992_006358 [Termitomyces sp. T32_za158]|nr:hypothetical protein C0992_006358 [Termitomyces sp. T32_za158]
MQRLIGQTTDRTDLAPPIIPKNEYEKESMLSEAQAWDDTFQESLRDFQLNFQEEEVTRSAGERGRLAEFDHTMTNFHGIFLNNHLRRQELYEKTDALQEERVQKADAVREVIFTQGQQDRVRAYEIEQEMRGKRVEWYCAARKELFRDGHQKLGEKCEALNAALVEQFNRLMERQKEIGEVAKEQPNHQDMVNLGDGQYPDGSSRPVIPQLVTSLPPSSKTSSSPSSPRAKDNYPSQPTSTESIDQEDTRISQSPSPSRKSLFQASSSPNPESLNSLTQPTSPDSNDQQEQEGSARSDGVEEEKFKQCFMRSQERRQATFLQDESKRAHRFRASEAARDAGESKRSTTFDETMKQWLTKSRIEQNYGREEERCRSEILRSTAFWKAESHHILVFEMSMMDIMDQAYAEEDLEEIYFQRQENMLLALYERQAIELNHRTEDQVVWLKFMRDRNPPFDIRKMMIGTSTRPESTSNTKATHNVERDMHKRQAYLVVLKRMHEMFERSQEVRAESFQKGAKERHYTFTINEAQREAKFVKVQQKRKELFDKAEDLRESEFEKAQKQREFDFQANERKREEDFNKNEAERNDRASQRKARDSGTAVSGNDVETATGMHF